MDRTSPRAADAWLAAEVTGQPLHVEGPWGEAEGSITAPTPPTTGWTRFFAHARTRTTPVVALVVPQAAGLENAARLAMLDDALCAGLLRGGAHVARIRQMHGPASPPADASEPASPEDAAHLVNAAAALCTAAAASVPGARPALAGTWLAGAVAASASARFDDLAFLAMAATPAPELMSRRTPENEDDPAWNASPTLRLVDALAALAPLEAVTLTRRPVLLLQGAADDGLPATHLEAWRSVLAFTNKSVDAVEIAYADELLQTLDAERQPIPDSTVALDLLAATVARWTAAQITAR